MTFGQFIKDNGQDEDIVLLIKNARRSNELMGIVFDDLTELTYGEVVEITEAYNESPLLGIVRVCCLHKVVQIEDLTPLPSKDVIYFWAWLDSQLVYISEMEKMLIANPDPLLEAAGSEVLMRYRHINVVDQLAGGDITKWESVTKLKYKDVFVKLLKDKDTNEVMDAYMKLKSASTKH